MTSYMMTCWVVFTASDRLSLLQFSFARVGEAYKSGIQQQSSDSLGKIFCSNSSFGSHWRTKTGGSKPHCEGRADAVVLVMHRWQRILGRKEMQRPSQRSQSTTSALRSMAVGTNPVAGRSESLISATYYNQSLDYGSCYLCPGLQILSYG